MSVTDGDFLIIGNKRYLKQSRWSKDKGITVRTAARHRAMGLPWLAWGGEIYIPETEGDDYIAARVVRRSPSRRRRRQAATQDSAAA